MTNEGFREYVNGNMLFWAANVKSTEGYKGTVLCLKEMNLPHVLCSLNCREFLAVLKYQTFV